MFEASEQEVTKLCLGLMGISAAFYPLNAFSCGQDRIIIIQLYFFFYLVRKLKYIYCMDVRTDKY
jgi:hypothetical protein